MITRLFSSKKTDSPPTRQLTIVHASKWKILSKGVSICLEKEVGYEIIATCTSGKQLLTLLEHTKPDFVITELALDEMNGLEVLPLMKQLYPELKVIVYSFINDPAIVLKAIRYGASAYVTSTEITEELINALKFCEAPGIYLSPGARKLHTPKLKELTRTERHVLLLLTQNKSVPEITHSLDLPEYIITLIIANLLTAAAVDTIEELPTAAKKEGVI